MNPMLAEFFLWAYVVMLGVLTGGALFERLVLVSIWASSPPDSVRNWNSDPRNALDPPGRFFKFVTPPVMLLMLIMFYIGFKGADLFRCWLLGSASLVLVVIVSTLVYFAPNMEVLTLRRGEALDSETIVKKTRMWVALQYIRLLLLIAGWLAALQAFRLHG